MVADHFAHDEIREEKLQTFEFEINQWNQRVIGWAKYRVRALNADEAREIAHAICRDRNRTARHCVYKLGLIEKVDGQQT